RCRWITGGQHRGLRCLHHTLIAGAYRFRDVHGLGASDHPMLLGIFAGQDNKMRKPDGFSLIELLIVVAIILIIAAIAIPNLLRARIAANEASAVSSIRTIVGAEATYQLAYPTVGFADTLAQLGPGGAGSTCSGPT